MSQYSTPDHEVELERTRLGMLAEARDPRTFAILEPLVAQALDATDGDVCLLEAGAGQGTVSAWLAERVGDRGRVVSADVDLRFHLDMPANTDVVQMDLQTEALPAEGYQLIHARALLQHLPEREAVMAKLVDALAPGGTMVIEDGAMLEFAEQTLPEPYATVHKIIAGAAHDEWRDANAGVRILGWMRDLGLRDLQVEGDVWAMRPGEASGEWWFLALERAIPMLVQYEVITEADGDRALEQVRTPGFVMLSPTSIAVTGHKPG